jgi:hypothetical protein
LNKTYIQVKLVDGESKTYTLVRNIVGAIEQVVGLRLVDSSTIRLAVDAKTTINSTAYHTVQGLKYIDYVLHRNLFR